MPLEIYWRDDSDNDSDDETQDASYRPMWRVIFPIDDATINHDATIAIGPRYMAPEHTSLNPDDNATIGLGQKDMLLNDTNPVRCTMCITCPCSYGTMQCSTCAASVQHLQYLQYLCSICTVPDSTRDSPSSVRSVDQVSSGLDQAGLSQPTNQPTDQPTNMFTYTQTNSGLPVLQNSGKSRMWEGKYTETGEENIGEGYRRGDATSIEKREKHEYMEHMEYP